MLPFGLIVILCHQIEILLERVGGLWLLVRAKCAVLFWQPSFVCLCVFFFFLGGGDDDTFG